MPWWGEALVGLTLAISVVGTVVPVLPGALLAAVAIAVWAFVEGGAAWFIAVLCGVLLLLGQVLKIVVPTRALSQAKVPMSVLGAGGVGAMVGFFVVPFIGLPVGFIVGVWVATVIRSGGLADAGHDTWLTLKAVGVSTLIEAASVYLAAVAWAVGAVAIGVT